MFRPFPKQVFRAVLLVTVFSCVVVAGAEYLAWSALLRWELLVAGGVAAGAHAWLALRAKAGRRRWRMPAIWCAAGLAVVVGFCVGPAPMEAGHAAYVLVVGFLLVTWVNGLRARSPHGWAEDLRLASLVGVAVWLFRPFLTSDFFGGVDARSYGYAMIDALQQVRAGVFPVLVGQGEFMFDGAIHPIRTAPYHQYLGMLLDLLTAHALKAVAIQHLTVICTMVQGGLTCYFCLTGLEPRRRGLAWLFSVLYVSAPAVAAAIYAQEMYMTFMAFAYLPCVVFANLQIVRKDSSRHWSALAAALALVWICHPPVATWLSLGTLALQGVRLLTSAWSARSWLRAAGGAVLFGALTAGYFWSIAEVAVRASAGDEKFWLLSGIAMAVAPVAIVRYLASSRWGWLIGATVLAVLTFPIQPFFARCFGVALAGATGLAVLAWRRPALRWRERLPETVVVLLLVAGVVALPWARPQPQSGSALGWVQRLWPQVYRPVSPGAQLPSDVQIGYALLAAMAVGLIGLFRAAAPEKRLLGLITGAWLMLCLPLPGLTRLLLNLVPKPVYAISGDIAWLRYLPTMIALAAFAGFLGLASWDWSRGRRRRVFLVLAGAALCWSLAESQKFVRRGYRNVNTRETIQAFYRTENARQFAYIFAGMPVSPYLTNGVLDYHLESRLLRVDDPTREVRPPAPAGAPEVTMTATADNVSPYWLHLEPKLELQPGEHVLVQFAFFDRPYQGTLICQGPEGFYREYPLPAAGFFEKSFGTATGRPKTIALWNDGPKPQPVELLFLQTALPPDGRAFGDFARVVFTRYQPAGLPVRTLALIPAYQAETNPGEAVYLETPRAYIPGYRARVNDQPAAVESSPNHMAMVKLAPGNNRVELRYTGTAALRATMALSLASWLGLGIYAWRGRRRSEPVVG